MAKILVVDDEDHIVMILKENLEEFSGFQVIPALNGVEAIEMVAKEKPDLMVLDIGMPRMDGWEVCRRLKGDPATQALPIIILTAYAQTSDQKKGLDLGANRFISEALRSDLPCRRNQYSPAGKEITRERFAEAGMELTRAWKARWQVICPQAAEAGAVVDVEALGGIAGIFACAKSIGTNL